MPILRIQAHASKIYGIDWSHTVANEIVTCSLDKTIKVWNVQTTPQDQNSQAPDPVVSIRTHYPVWRARTLPFGEGVLSLAQRGETALEMYAKSRDTPVEIFEGHTDVVKEFVWRKGGQGLMPRRLLRSA
jgi:WD40 repeat protein